LSRKNAILGVSHDLLSEVTDMDSVVLGNVVRVHYTGKHEDGTIFDDSRGHEPLEFTVGSEELIEGFSQAVIGMTVGESKQVAVSPEQGYGHHDPALTHRMSRSEVPDEVEVGDVLRAVRGDDEIQVWVSEIDEDEVLIDSNHPLAGKTLIFDLELVSICPPTCGHSD
jgi:peptidylprolyl isomerase